MKNSIRLLILSLIISLSAQNLWAAEKFFICDVTKQLVEKGTGMSDREEVELKATNGDPQILEGDLGVAGEARAVVSVNLDDWRTTNYFGSKIKVNLAGRLVEVSSESKDATPKLSFQKKNQKGQLIELSIQCSLKKEEIKKAAE